MFSGTTSLAALALPAASACFCTARQAIDELHSKVGRFGALSMIDFVDPVAFWGLLLVQLAGLTSVVLGRLPRHGKTHDYCRGIYLGCLTVLALATLSAVMWDSSWWAWCGTTLSLMAVGGTLDLGSPISASGF